jgi:two-component system response regulator GlrR
VEVTAGDRDDTAEGRRTVAVADEHAAGAAVQRFQLDVVEGPASGTASESRGDSCAIGSHPSNDLVIDDPTVSRFHCEIRIDEGRACIIDCGSKNGVLVDGLMVRDAFLRGDALIRLGRSALRFHFSDERNPVALSDKLQFGSLVGRSAAMRAAFAVLERAAATDATVLIEGETGTGKEGAASAIHRASARRDGPFVIVDCSAIPPNLLESEFFGHEKGAFTGAQSQRIGAFEEASGGTLFLDEIGELPLDLQPKLLRVLEQREIRRIGSNSYHPVDVRVVAATNRDLRREVNEKRFRSDVYYRLAVVKVRLPALRERPEDVPLLVENMLATMKASANAVATLTTPEFIARVQYASWPGNVRELRNYLERCLVFEEPQPLVEPSDDARSPIEIDLPLEEARQRVNHEFERRYVAALLERHGGKVAAAAEAAGVARGYFYRLVQRHRLR